MEIEATEPVQTDGQPFNMEIDTADPEAALMELSNVMEALEKEPQNLQLLQRCLDLSRAAQFLEQEERTLRRLVELKGCSRAVWDPVLESIDNSLEGSSGAESDSETVELLLKITLDYCDAPLLARAARLVYKYALDADADQYEQDDKEEGSNSVQFRALKKVFEEDEARVLFTEISRLAAHDMSFSQEVWNCWLQWEMKVMQHLKGDARSSAVAQIHKIYLDTLATAHANHTATSEAYSAFNSTYCSEDYEANMVRATKASSKANQKFSEREAWEQGYVALVENQQQLSPQDQRNAQIQYLYAYLEMEMDTKKGKKMDSKLVGNVYERLLAVLARWDAVEGKHAEAAIWLRYGQFLASTNGISKAQILSTWQRATRCCPGSGELWAKLLRYQETLDHDPQALTDSYVRALSLGELTKKSSEPQNKAIKSKGKGKEREQAQLNSDTSVDQLVALEMAWVSYMRRLQEKMGSSPEEDQVEASLRAALHNCHQVSSRDPTVYKLDKYLATWLERLGKPEAALEALESALKTHGKSYSVWTDLTDLLIRSGEYAKARSTFKTAASRTNIDWQDAVMSAWIAFEEYYGSAETLEVALGRVQDIREKATVRQYISQQSSQAHTQAQPAPQSSEIPALPAKIETAPVMDPATQQDSQQHGVAESKDEAESSGGRKRKTEAEDESTPKKARTESDPALVRDREHSTVFVSGFDDGVGEEDLRGLFGECGEIREILISKTGDHVYATVEFIDRNDVPVALTRDKKFIKGQQLQVYMAWRTTLFVTNFPESADDAWIRDKFGKFGEILETRWPSRKFKSSRRFVYVQYTTPASAESALALHGEKNGEFALSVLISNPERKKERSDANSARREVYISHLSRFAEEKDLKRVFSEYGTIKRVDVAQNEDGTCKGFAFVEFGDESAAAAALGANGKEIKKRNITVSASNAKAKPAAKKFANTTEKVLAANDLSARTIRLKGLPERTQEGLLEQELRKTMEVKRVEVLQDTGEAVVELMSAAEVGKVLLRSDPLTYRGSALEVLPEGSARPVAPAAKETAPAPTTSTGFKPRPPKAAGKKRIAVGTASAASSTPVTRASTNGSANTSASLAAPSAGAKSQDDFRKMLMGGK